MSSQPIDWTKVPHTELVSDLEVMVKVAEAKAGKKQWREEEVEVEAEAEVEAEHRRQKEAQKAEEAWKAEEAQWVEEERWAEIV
ncbi:hypothetical protein SCLCIDRAFT_34053 [Scleroderma citrinum Foug A]|uniref:Uncharacterized protein n=1 Tax=Scleroderma citrinum Foug A TaxID=1036808 RepID=A0A0C3D3N8_9AGAM|nr:hypothetical protein SCLCIDRAFT_34053 [Scleroderma citrinum Foug A]